MRGGSPANKAAGHAVGATAPTTVEMKPQRGEGGSDKSEHSVSKKQWEAVLNNR